MPDLCLAVLNVMPDLCMVNVHDCSVVSSAKILYTVEPVLDDHPFCPAIAVSQDRWSLIAGRTKIMFYYCVAYRQPGSKWDGHGTITFK